MEEQRAWPLRPKWCERVTRFYSVILCMACCERVKCEHSLTCKRWHRRQSPSIAFCDSWCCVASCMHPSCWPTCSVMLKSYLVVQASLRHSQYFACNTSWDTIFHLTQLISHSQQLQFFPYLLKVDVLTELDLASRIEAHGFQFDGRTAPYPHPPPAPTSLHSQQMSRRSVRSEFNPDGNPQGWCLAKACSKDPRYIPWGVLWGDCCNLFSC